MLKSDFSKDGNLKTERLKFQKIYNVSRGTLKLFDEYHNFLIKKNKGFNLIGSGTKGSIWTRHFADSAKIFFLIKSLKNEKDKIRFVDVGSGAGFPGLVVSVLCLEDDIGMDITLFESNKKKSLFLLELKKRLKLQLKVEASRIENSFDKFDIICCRALASLNKILNLCENSIHKNTLFLLPKGSNWSKEIKVAKKEWNFQFKIVKNNIEIDKSGGVTLIVSKVKKK